MIWLDLTENIMTYSDTSFQSWIWICRQYNLSFYQGMYLFSIERFIVWHTARPPIYPGVPPLIWTSFTWQPLPEGGYFWLGINLHFFTTKWKWLKNFDITWYPTYDFVSVSSLRTWKFPLFPHFFQDFESPLAISSNRANRQQKSNRRAPNRF